METVPPTSSSGEALAATALETKGERLQPGTIAGEYKVEAHVGAGAMGDVYRAVHPVIGKTVAIKVIKRKLASSPEAIERFIREAKAVNRVSHPNVVDVFATGRLPDGRLWLAMDFLEGESLGKRLRRDGPLALDAVLDVLRPVCEALAAAHAHRVVHRDLKSDNIFLARPAAPTVDGGKERVYVLDFGIAKVLHDVAAETGVQPSLTSEGSWIGTPAYMAPEQWTSEGAGPASDVYALGVVAYEMIAGKPPFTAPSLPAIMEQHFRAEPPSLATTIGGKVRIPASLEAAIAHALAKKPEDRPAGAMAFLEEVEAAIAVKGRGTSARTVRGAPGQGHPRARWPLIAAGGVALAAGIAVAVMAFRSGGDGEPRRPAATPAIGPTEGTCVLSVTSQPSGARVIRDARAVGVTPMIVRARDGEVVELALARPGYARATRRVTATTQDQAVEVALDPIRGFEGTWRIPGGELRAFERQGEQVAAYRLPRVDAAREFLRFFTFEPDEERVVFASTEELVDEHAADEPSCRIRLGAEYRYVPDEDRLELRRQQAQYKLTEGRCVMLGPARWGEFQPVERLAHAAPVTTVSSQGGGTITADTAVKGKKPPAPRPTPTKAPPEKIPPIQQKNVAPPQAEGNANREAEPQSYAPQKSPRPTKGESGDPKPAESK